MGRKAVNSGEREGVASGSHACLQIYTGIRLCTYKLASVSVYTVHVNLHVGIKYACIQIICAYVCVYVQ